MTAPRTLYEKIWDAHVVERRDDGTCLVYIDRHLVHEVTSPQAFEGLRAAGRAPAGRDVPEVDEDVVRALTRADPLALATAMENDLQAPAVALFPELSDVMDVAMDEGALRAMVSGSGPTLLLAAHSEQDALRLATAVEERTGVAALPVHGPVPGAHVL